MRIYKPAYKDKRSGKKKNCQYWHIDFTDNQQIRRRLPAFSNKRATEKAAERIEELLSSGGILSPELQQWIEKIPEKIRENLIRLGVIDSRRLLNQLGKELTGHIEDFYGSLKVRNNERYAKQVKSAIGHIFTECGFVNYNDIDANRLYIFLADLQGDGGFGQRSFNYYLKSCKQFCKWMIKERRATENHLLHLSCITQTEKRRQRRALTLTEQRKLLETAETGEKHHNLTGAERALVYRLALQTGFRANEIRSLTVSSFDFDNQTVTVDAGYSKNKKTSTLRLKQETADDLRAYLFGKMPNVKAFAIPVQPSKMIQKDLEAAGISYKTFDGQADFHSLRHTFITNLVNAGVQPNVVMKLARHSTITLTMDYYTHTLRESEDAAIEKLPDLTTDKQTEKTTKKIG